MERKLLNRELFVQLAFRAAVNTDIPQHAKVEIIKEITSATTEAALSDIKAKVEAFPLSCDIATIRKTGDRFQNIAAVLTTTEKANFLAAMEDNTDPSTLEPEDGSVYF